MLETRINEIIANVLENKIFENSDSIDKIEIIMALEDEFKINITDEDSQKIYTVKDIIEYVRKKI